MNRDPNFCICTQLLDTIIDAKMRSRTTLSLPCAIIQVCHTLIYDAEFDAYAPTRV